MEVIRHFLCAHDRDLVGQARVDGLRDALRRRPALDVYGNHVCQRVHAGVRAPGNGKALDRRERLV